MFSQGTFQILQNHTFILSDLKRAVETTPFTTSIKAKGMKKNKVYTHHVLQRSSTKHLKHCIRLRRRNTKNNGLLTNSRGVFIQCCSQLPRDKTSLRLKILYLLVFQGSVPRVRSTFSAHTHLSRRVCCLLRIDGFDSKMCGLLRFFPVATAAAAAMPTGPEGISRRNSLLELTTHQLFI